MLGKHDDRGWTMDGSMGWGGWLMMSVLLVLTVCLLAALVVWLLRFNAVAGTARIGPPRTSPARELLDQRFASGEIGEEDYRTRVRVLGGG